MSIEDDTVTPDSPIPSFVRAARAAMAMSQTDFAATLGVNQTTISHWERDIAPGYVAMTLMSMQSGLPLPGVPLSMTPAGANGFGAAHVQLLAKGMADARRRLPKVMLHALDASPPKTLEELAEFVKMLADVLERYPDPDSR